ncbi:disintegrin-like metalloprotease [Purpureocillium lilacinum]|uniref:Disintegrin and metalloproteinase domain-containing protein B n=1 Tax=Purpureocillium lilacinum TaxID=33203 RepID=A0A179F7C2_PURLI|nr:disintegrin-like metalloprotease [Purpureocillium lilacinum]OAQ61307.1 disintegrin-like metalloprotease [Purpureocillium lilacinum]
MVTLRTLASALARVALCAPSSLAFSVKRNPIGYLSLVDDPVIKTPSHRAHYLSKFDLTFTLHDGRQSIRLALDPNDDILHDDFAITLMGEDGTVRDVQKVPRTEHRVYRGDAFIERPSHRGWSKAGWARVTIHRDGEHPVFDGAFRIDGDNHHIQTADQYQKLRGDDDPVVQHLADSEERMVVWRDSDVVNFSDEHNELKRSVGDESLCNADTLKFNSKFQTESLSHNTLPGVDFRSLFGRQSIDGGGDSGSGLNLLNSIGSVDGCPTTRKVALVGIATDCNYWDGFDNKEALTKNVIGMVNKASEVYESTFKISLGIQNLTILGKNCPATAAAATPWNVACAPQTTISDRLNTFSRWRGQFKDDNAYWSLLTKCATDSTVGLAWSGQLCRGSGDNSNGKGNETVAATNVVVRTDTEWQIFAHETGHTFGAIHDCTSSTCLADKSRRRCCPLSRTSCDAGGKFIMNPSTGSGITQFSACSIGNICSRLKSNMIKGNCLTDNKNVKTITGSQCGNGIVENGEDCDCGGEDGCKNSKCCNPQTCKFLNGAVCDASNEDCCTDQCQFASNGTVCRPSTGVCDVEEVCPGSHASCPEDKHKSDGDSCGSGLQCASGQCTSRDQQCKNMASSYSGRSNTSACPESGCLLACTSPEMGPDQCVTYNQNFLDGTDCGAGGKCSNGSCRGASTAKEIGDWIQNHKAMFISVVSVVGGLILIAILSCIVSAIRKCSHHGKQPKPPKMSNWPSYNAGGPNCRAQQWNQNQQWTQSSSALQGGQGPPQSFYSYPPPLAIDRERWLNRQRSMRYA